MASIPPEPPEPARRRTFAGLVVEDIRSVRRWLAVLGALAVIATAVAVYALLEGGESADDEQVTQLERRLVEAERELGRASEESDVNRLERRERRNAEQSDVQRLGFQLSRLDRRLRRVEGDVVDAVDAAAGAGRGISGLQDRVTGIANRLEDVEDRQPRGR